MPRHVVVDGSNLATEGRALPSLRQLNEAVLAYMAENPDALITVVVDASFGHRIDPREVAEFDAAVSNNEIVAPPAGAIGRGDAFVLSIANKVNATILSNDSYQEFHGTYTWLFDEGRLVGGKPVPHIGWVFVNRLPVRGPTSRKSVSEAKRGGRAPRVKAASPEASQPMPVPASPPPGAILQKSGRGRDEAKAAAAAAKPGHPAKQTDSGKGAPPKPEPTPKSTGTNDLLAFLNFVEHHQPGSSVNAIVESYSSHGAYVRIGDVKGYVPLSLMADPAPRSAREFMKVGESVTLV
ncbi:MAG: NYN domain-containing protein, partial [Ilumatobacteraceae bacterium]